MSPAAVFSLLPGVPADRHLLCLGAHPDDIEIGAGGTILRLAAEGWFGEVTWVVFSGGPAREPEGRASADAFLGPDVRRTIAFHDFRDGFFPSRSAEIKEAFETLKTGRGPDMILCPRLADAHQDHRLVAELTWNTFREHLVLEYEIPKYDGDLRTPNVYVPLSASTLDRKIELLEASFPSQASRQWFDPETFRGLARIRGVEAGARVRYAEGFHARKIVVGAEPPVDPPASSGAG